MKHYNWCFSSFDIALPASFDQLSLKSTTWTQSWLQSQTQRLPCGRILVLTQMEKESPIIRMGRLCSKAVAVRGTETIKWQLQLLPSSGLLQRLLAQVGIRCECCKSIMNCQENLRNCSSQPMSPDERCQGLKNLAWPIHTCDQAQMLPHTRA